MSYFAMGGVRAEMGMRSVFPLTSPPIATGRGFEPGGPRLKDSAEDGEAAAARERVHAVLDRALHLLVLLVDVGVVARPLRVVVELDRVEEGGADLGRQRQ